MITSRAGRIETPSKLADEPVEFSHELDEPGWELRRIEIVAGGHAAVAPRHDQSEQLWQQDAPAGR
ncbi:DUF6881 domain-containing protein [Chloroflexus aurantiacus]